VVVINDRWGSDTYGTHGGVYTAEYSDQYWLNHAWEENSGVDIHSYGFNRNTDATHYLTSEYLIHLLIRSVALGGNLLLDIGPAGDGSIPVVFQERLLDIGAWLDVNGNAIYSTRIWRAQSEQNNTIFYTKNPKTGLVYALLTYWPVNSAIVLQTPIATAKTQVNLLGYNGTPLKYTYSPSSGMTVALPPLTISQYPCQHAWALQLTAVQ